MTWFQQLPRERLLITDVDVLDPRDGSLRPGQDLLLDQGRVESMGPAGHIGGTGAVVVPGEGRTALPGLIDAHLHVCGTYGVEQPTTADLLEMPDQIGRNLRALVESGVTTVRDMGAPLKLIRWLKGLARQGRLRAPRVLSPGPVLTPPGGYPAFMAPLGPPIRWAVGQVKAELRTARDARRWVDRIAAHAMDCVKVMYTSADYDDRRSPLPLLPGELLRAITDRAHHHGLPVAVHQVWQADLHRLLDLPFDTLEHLCIDAPMTEHDVDRIRRRDLPVSTTLMTYGMLDFAERLLPLVERNADGRFSKRARRNLLPLVREVVAGSHRVPYIGRRVIETGMTHMLTSLRMLRRAGVRALAGTDQGGAVTPCGMIRWELESYLRAGYTPLEALQAATTLPARALGRPELGWLAQGHPADVILTRGNPAEAVDALSRVDVVVRDGRVMSNRL